MTGVVVRARYVGLTLLLAVIATVTGLGSGGFAPARADVATGGVLEQGDWIFYPQQYRLENATLEKIQGVSEPGGCGFSGDLTLEPGQNVIELIQLAANPTTCEAIVETGTPPAAVLAARSAGQDLPAAQFPCLASITTTTPPAGADVELPSTSVPSVGTWRHSEGYLRSNYEDPVCIEVNAVKDILKWDWDGIHVYCQCNTGDGLVEYKWYETSGWRLESQNVDRGRKPLNCHNLGGGLGNNCTMAYVNADAHFVNDAFCGPFTATETQYFDHEIMGFWNGKLGGSWESHTKYGGCSDLLHFHHELVRTYN